MKVGTHWGGMAVVGHVTENPDFQCEYGEQYMQCEQEPRYTVEIVSMKDEGEPVAISSLPGYLLDMLREELIVMYREIKQECEPCFQYA